MTKLHDLHRVGGQSPWLDNLRRDWILDGELAHWIERGVRGVTSNPSIFQKAMTGQDVYDEQFSALAAQGAARQPADVGPPLGIVAHGQKQAVGINVGRGHQPPPVVAAFGREAHGRALQVQAGAQDGLGLRQQRVVARQLW